MTKSHRETDEVSQRDATKTKDSKTKYISPDSRSKKHVIRVHSD